MAFNYEDHFVDTTLDTIQPGEFFFLKRTNQACIKVLASPGFNPDTYNAYNLLTKKPMVLDEKEPITAMTVNEYHAFLARLAR